VPIGQLHRGITAVFYGRRHIPAPRRECVCGRRRPRRADGTLIIANPRCRLVSKDDVDESGERA
jgi:hypothetical protein